MRRKIRVLYVAAESGPYAKVGGLGEVASSLPRVLSENNIDIRRVVPLYRQVNCKLKYKCDFPVLMGSGYQTCVVKYDAEEKIVPTYFIANDNYFNRNEIYKYYDDGERFLFFCKSVIKMLEHISFKPDIIHVNDWHTGFIPTLIKIDRKDIKTIFTIHNLNYQGWIGSEYLNEEEISEEDLISLGHPENLNFMRGGIIHSDYITTVSRSYSEEILTPEFGAGMQELLKERRNRIQGIINGIDENLYNPYLSEELIYPYKIGDIEKKRGNKRYLQKQMGLKEEDVPLIAAITRLEDQKGMDILIKALKKLEIPYQFVLLGSGNKYYEDLFNELSRTYPGKISVRFSYNIDLAKKIYAGSDMFVMPSKYEPGGLGQLIAMRYGSVPIVRHTGGLKDTVIDYYENQGVGNGFCFEEYSPEALLKAINKAVGVYNSDHWQKLIKNGMEADWSWKKSGLEYLELYKKMYLR